MADHVHHPGAPEEASNGVSIERALRQVFELSGDLLAVVDAEGRYRRVNPAFTRVLGWTEEELLGRRGRLFVHPDDQERTEKTACSLAEGRTTRRFENRYRAKDGSYRWLSWTAVPVPQDGLIYAAAQDISDRKRSEAERERLLGELQRAQAQAQADLDAMKRLQEVSALFVEGQDLEPVLVRILDAAIAISGADFGNVQLLAPGASDLRIVAQRGFSDDWLAFWDHVHEGQGVCGTALEREGRVIVEDVERSPIFVGTPALEMQRRAGVRAVQSTPLVSRSGRPVGIFSTHYRETKRPDARALRLLDLLARQAADIIERSQAEEALRRSEERFAKAFRSNPAAIALITVPEGRLVDVNETWVEIFGHRREEAVGRTTPELGLWPDLRARDRVAEAFRRHGAIRGREASLRRRSGENFPVLLSLDPIQLGGEEVAVVTFEDLTERKHNERALREANARLAEADRRKDEFLAMLGHELRNPLSAIRSGSQLLERIPSGDDPRIARTCGIIDRQSRHMARLIDGLLEVSRITRGKIELERETCDLRTVLEGVLHDRFAHVTRRGLVLRPHFPPHPVWVTGDGVRLAQVLDNLVGNAIKFTTAPGTIGVRLGAEGAEAVIRVEDTGAGIPPELIPHLFEPFRQGPQDIVRTAGGLGLGLAIAKGMIELHGGTIEAHSAGPGEGAEFVVRLPVAPAPGASEPRPARPGGQPRRILLVEDNLDAASALQELLELGGHEVVHVGNGADALDRLRQEGFDLILCDLGLPGMSGFGVARAIREDTALRGSFLVALTGYAQPEDRARTREAGFDEHLAKPVGLEALEALLARVASPKRS